VGVLTAEQLDRYGAFRRSSIREPLRALLRAATSASARPGPNDRVLLVLASIAKTFVGELVEGARAAAAAAGEAGPLRPAHVRAAHAALRAGGRVEGAPPPRRRFAL
jgi:transcription initiation factor TFIID subunit 11